MKNNIKILRQEMKLSQKELGQHLNVSRQTINAIETGKFALKYFTDYLSPSKKSLIQKRLMDISKKGYPSTGIVI